MPLQSSQICALAAQAAGVPGWTAQAGQLLNMVLSDLCETYDFDAARGTVTLSITGSTGSGPYNLPSDYLRAEEGDAFYTLNQVPYALIAIDLAEYDALTQQGGIAAYPDFYATDMSQSPPAIYFWPPPAQVLPVTIRYRRQMPDITAPEASSTVPWFPNQNYLITRLTGELMKIADDERCAQFLGEGPAGAQGILKRYLELKDDSSSRAKTVKLDQRRFGTAFNRLPGTKVIGPL